MFRLDCNRIAFRNEKRTEFQSFAEPKLGFGANLQIFAPPLAA